MSPGRARADNAAMSRRAALVDAQWLQAHLQDPAVRIVDASWYLPSEGRDPKAEFMAGHIPGAVFFPIDAIADQSSGLPHMLPSSFEFQSAVGALGIGAGDSVIVYDGAGLFSAPRVWWTFRAFGHDDVRILDGGLPRWRAEGFELESGPVHPTPRTYEARFRPELVRDIEWMRTTPAQVVDARGSARFTGSAPEPRSGVKSGHIPGSVNLPFVNLVTDGGLAPDDALRQAFTRAGVDLGQPIDATCGSGITACIIALAAFVVGTPAAAVYDGSWSEWGARDDTPIG